MLLRACTLRGENVRFELSDCPVTVTEGTFALTGIANSKIMYLNTIMRGCESEDIFEGDLVYDAEDNLLGYVIYIGGFKLQKIDGSVTKLEIGNHIKVKVGNITSARIVSSNPSRTPLLFKYEDSLVYMSLFLYKLENGNIAVTGKSYAGKQLVPSKLQFFTGLVCDGAQVFFGDEVDGHAVKLCGLYPGIIKDGQVQTLD